MRRRTALCTLVAGLVVAGLLAWRSRGGDRLSYYAPDEYVARADALIRRGHLVADCGSDPIRLVPRLDGASAEDRAWYRDSYLAADVARFNDDPEGFGWAFAIDADCRLRGVNPVVHAIELPFRRRVDWLGSILWHGRGSDAVLRSARRTLTLRRPEELVPTREVAATRVGSGESLHNEGAVLLYLAGGRGQPGARLFHVGDRVVVHNRVRARAPERLRLMGHQVPVGMLLRLESGDWLHLAADAPVPVAETFVYAGGEALAAASFVQRRNERYERLSEDPGLGLVTDPVQDRTFPYFDLVAKSLDAGLRSLPQERAEELARGLDLRLTMEREVQLRLSDLFRGYCDRVAREERLAEPFAAGMTVIDGRSGEVLALATYPHPADLAARPPEDDVRRRRLLRNQNLVRHPIGSAMKPFLFAAIADAFPALRRLVIAGHEPERHHRELFHCEIPTGYHLLAGHGERVDFATALEISCNKFTVELATLALAADLAADPATGAVPLDAGVEWPLPGARSGVWIAGRELAGAPDLGGYVFREDARPRDPETAAAVRCASVDRFEQVRYRPLLGRLTGAATYLGRVPASLPDDATRRQLEQGYVTNRYDLEPWRPVLDRLIAGAGEDAGWKVRAALQEISPERVNLAFNQVTRLRGDYLSLVLGGGTSIWTNLQLAEAMSRLVTGREVEARLAGVLAADGDEPPDGVSAGEESAEDSDDAEDRPLRLGLDPEARRLVLGALGRVVEGGRGTARAVRDELAAVRRDFPGERVELYSKTGTPVIERSVPAAVATALERLVVRRRLRLVGGALEVHVGGEVVPYRRSGQRRRDAWLEALRRALADVGFAKSAGALLPPIRRILDRFEADRRSRRADPAELDGPLRVEAGELRLHRDDRLFRSRLERSTGAVYVLSLVRLPADVRRPVPTVDDLDRDGVRIVTAAIYLEAGPDSGVAVGAAEELLPELAALLR